MVRYRPWRELLHTAVRRGMWDVGRGVSNGNGNGNGNCGEGPHPAAAGPRRVRCREAGPGRRTTGVWGVG